MREYIKPPANKTLSDVELDGPHRSCSVAVFPTQADCGLTHSGMFHHHHHHRHSAPLDARSPHHSAVSASTSSSSSSSSSLSLPGWGAGEETRGSPRRGRKTGPPQRSPLMDCLNPFTSGRYERAPHTSQQEGGRRGGRHQGMLAAGSPSTHDPSVSFPYTAAANTLADITMVPVPCGSSTHSLSPTHPGGPVASQGLHMGSMGVQGGLPHTYGQSSESPCSPTTDHDLPPLYSDMIENSNSHSSASRPSEPRTKSGKI